MPDSPAATADATTTAPAAVTVVETPTTAPATEPAATAATTAPADGLPDDPAALKQLIADLRKENGSARTTAKQRAADEARAEVTQQIGKALGLIKDGDTTPDAAQLTEQVTQAQQAARDSQIELAVYRTATQHGGNPAALTDSRSFLAKVATLDPTAEDFTTKVTAAAKAAVTENPSLRAAPVAGSSSVDHAGGSGEGNAKPTTLEDAIAQKMAR